jgi:hypothetical protein
MTTSQSKNAAQATALPEPFALNLQAFTWPLQAWASALQAMSAGPRTGLAGSGETALPWAGMSWPGALWPHMQALGMAWPGAAWPDFGLAGAASAGGEGKPFPNFAWPGFNWPNVMPGSAWPGLPGQGFSWPGSMWPGSMWPGSMWPGSMGSAPGASSGGFGLTPTALASLFLAGLSQFHSMLQGSGAPHVTQVSFAWPGDVLSGYFKWLSALPHLAWAGSSANDAAGQTPANGQPFAWPGLVQWPGSAAAAWPSGAWQSFARFWESRLRELASIYTIPPALSVGPV